MLVGFLGAPCSGKTTTAAKLFASLKEGGIPAELVVEEARYYIAEKRRQKGVVPVELTDDDQIEILFKQLYRERDMKFSSGREVAVITDSSPLNSLLYMTPEKYDDLVETIFKMLAGHYDVLFLCHPVQPSFAPDPNRLHSYDESLEIHKLLKKMLNEHEHLLGCDIVPLTGNPTLRFSEAHSATLSKMVA